MAVSPELSEHVRDLFGGLGPIQIKRMFGGAGVYLGDAMFALIDGNDAIYLRGDAEIGADLEKIGCERWVYDGKGKPVAMPYWRLPETAMDDPEEAISWARRALVPAEAAAAEKRAAKSRKAVKQKMIDAANAGS